MYTYKIRFLSVLVLALCNTGISGDSEQLKFHGPILQWHHDPLRSTTITWVEDITVEIPDPPVWKEGEAGFGYGDEDDATVLPNMRGNFTRVFLAKSFYLPSPKPNGELILKVDYDDAFVAWINGTEVARSDNLKGHYVEADVTKRHEAGTAEEFPLKETDMYLKKGKNLLSITGYNKSIRSSDFSLNPSLQLGSKVLIPENSSWNYLADIDPHPRWFLRDPLDPQPLPIARSEPSNWELGIRRRNSGSAFRKLEISNRPFGETMAIVFEARAENLAPGTEYEFRMKANGKTVRTSWFRTAPRTNSRKIRFVTGGDMGTESAIPICKVAGAEDPLFAMIGGDLAYANARDAWKWFDWLDNWSDFIVGKGGRQIPIIAGIGNHEMKTFWRARKSDAPFYYSLFDLPGGEPNFTIDFGNYMSIVLLDSNHSKRVGTQTLWLGTQLANRENVPHLFALYHRPAWGTGVKGNIKSIQRQWSPLFEKHGVDCVFENDHHTYKRTKKIKGGKPDNKEGVLYLGDGAWGASLRKIKPEDIASVRGDRYLAYYTGEKHHLITVTLSPDGRKTYEAKDRNGIAFDTFSDYGTPPREAPLIELPVTAP